MEDKSQDYLEEFLLNPKPGTAAAAARDFGIDLTLTVQNLRFTPEERVRRLDRFIDAAKKNRTNSRLVRNPHDAVGDRVSRAFASAKEYLRVRDQKKAVTHQE